MSIKRSNRFRQSFFGALLPAAVLLVLPMGARAQAYPCGSPGPDEQIVGMTQGGNGVASVPLCQRVDNGDDRGEENAPQAPPDPVQAGIGSLIQIQQTELGILGRIEELKKDPRYAPIIAGKWDFYQDRKSGRPGEFCSALFTNAAGMVRVSGPGGDFPGAMITFWGPDLPKPGKQRVINVSLTQSDDNKPQKVRAYSYTQQGLDYGAIALAIPTADALIDNLVDRLSFTLEVDGKRVLFIGWHSGQKARDRLRQCMGKRGG